jgi:hypothetical protein
MPKWKEFLKDQSDEFKEDSKDVNEKLNKARADLEAKWTDNSQRESLMSRWYRGMKEPNRQRLLMQAVQEITSLAQQYGLDRDSAVTLAPELFNSPEVMHKESFLIKEFANTAINRDFDEDIDAITDFFRLNAQMGQRPPTVRLVRNRTKKHVEYTNPKETIWWFAVQRRLLTCVFILSLLEQIREFNAKVVINNLQEIAHKVKFLIQFAYFLASRIEIWKWFS